MAKYKVGDKVRVISNGEHKRYYMEDKSIHDTMVDAMLEFCGKVVTIERVDTKYGIKECGYCWVDEMFEGLADEEPKTFKVGDRVRTINDTWAKKGELGTIIPCPPEFSGLLIEFDNEVGGHDGDGRGKPGHCWWVSDDDIELVESKPTPKPTPIEVNITVNLYENSCWYCRKGGVVDLYLNGAMGICPSCKRVCNNTPFKLEHKGSAVIEFKPPKKKPKKNQPLTREEVEALPDGSKVFVVFNERKDDKWVNVPDWNTSLTCWRTKHRNKLEWKHGFVGIDEIDDGDNAFNVYLEEPERPKPELPF